MARRAAPPTLRAPTPYKQLAIFGDIFERVRAQYVTPPEDAKLIESAINGI